MAYTCRLPGKEKGAPFWALINEKGVPFGHSPKQTQAFKALIKEKGAPFLALIGGKGVRFWRNSKKGAPFSAP